MANHASARKRVRRNARRDVINTSRKSRVRTFIKKVEEAIESGDAKAAQEAFKRMQPELLRGVAKGVFHKNAASRKLSRLSNRIKAISA